VGVTGCRDRARIALLLLVPSLWAATCAWLGPAAVSPLLGLSAAALSVAAGLALLPLAFRRAERQEPKDHPLPEAPLTSAVRRYQALFECSPLPLVVTDEAGVLLEVNHAAEAYLPGPRGDALGRSLADVFRAEPGRAGWSGRSADRDVRAESRDVPVGSRAVRLHALSFAAPAQRSPVEAVARFAGHLAHDFNNLLTTVVGYADMIRLTSDPSKAARFLDEVQEGARRIGQLTERLSAMGWKHPVPPGPQDVGAWLEQAAIGVRALAGPGVEVTLDVGAGLPAVSLDGGRLRRALECVVTNAVEAMGGRGTLVLRARCEEGGSGGTEAVVEVVDSGPGVAEEVRPSVLEPFVSTKERAVGSGLGLAIANTVLARHGGCVEVASVPGRGTAVRFRLPAATSARPTVLVVEDDDLVRDVAVRCLDRLGFGSIAAASRDEALARAASHDGRIDLVLSDIVMSGMGPAEFASALRKTRGDAGWLFMTGHDEWSAPPADVPGAANALLRKPFTEASLSRHVSAALGARVV
jgi:signal transduction histidine kinase/ActR/RegA family two-component response regulator